MKTLEQIKNDYAINKGYLSWKGLLSILLYDLDLICKHENEVMKIYAMECLKLASENATCNNEDFYWSSMIDKESITNENNIIK